MKKAIKIVIMIMVLMLVIAAMVGCEKECEHIGGVATCTEEAICEICGAPYGGMAAHKKGFTTPVESDCTNPGMTASSYCIECGEVFIEAQEVSPKGHSFIDKPGKEATCAEEGYTAYKQCEVCGEIEGKEAVAGEHTYGEADENGNKVCGVCGEILVSTGEGLQAALDNAVKGTVIRLTGGVHYGIVYLRPSDNEGVTKVVDWIGNNYRYETYSLFEDITLIGAEGATIDAIEIEGGTYYNTEHSQMDKYPVMLSLIELRNVTLEGITFTGKGGYDPQGHGNAINLSGSNIKVDGLNIVDCVLENPENNARLIYKTESTTHVHKFAYGEETFEFSPTLKDIEIVGCVFNGGYIGVELRETENVLISECHFKISDRGILLPVNTGCTYSGTIEISFNTFEDGKERFIRADGIGDATLKILNNNVVNYMGADADFIKATGVTGEYVVEMNDATDGSGENRELVITIQ